MKKFMTLLTALLCSICLVGCSDATAKLKDSSTVLFSVGNKNVTKGDLYTMMSALDGASTAISNVDTTIARNEIEITEEMKQEAETSLEYYKSYYGDTFVTHLEQVGMTEESYLNDVLIASLQAQELVTKYINDNYSDLVARFSPVKATLR